MVEDVVMIIQSVGVVAVAVALGIVLLARWLFLERRLRREGARFQQMKHAWSIFDASSDLVFFKDRSLRYQVANKAHENLFKVPMGEIINRRDHDFMPEETADECRRSDSMALEQGSYSGQERIGDSWYDVIKHRVEDAAGRAVGVAAIIRDVTALKRAEEELRASEEMFRQIVETSDDLIAWVDSSIKFTFVNHASEHFFGLASRECLGRSPLEFVHPEDVDDTRRNLTDWIDGRIERASYANRCCALDGRVHHVSWSVRLHYDNGGNVVGLNGIGHDISGRVEAEQKLQQRLAMDAALARLAEELLKPTGIEDISDLVLDTAKELTGAVFGFVGAMDSETGHMVSHTLTRGIWEQCNVPDKSVVFTKFCGLWGWVLKSLEPVLTNDPQSHEHSTGVPEGHIPIENFLSVPCIVGGRLVGQIALANSPAGFSEDDLHTALRLAVLFSLATRRREMESELRVARDKALEGNRAKSEFLAKVSHELRTPMNAILGLSDMLMDTRMDSAQLKHLNSLKSSASALLVIINDMLNASTLESGRHVLEKTTFELGPLLTTVINSLSPRAENKGLSLAIELDGDLPRYVIGDPDHLEQIIVKLVGNAIKFTDSGHVTVRAWCAEAMAPMHEQGPRPLLKEQDASPGEHFALHVSINDTGPGIPFEQQEEVFELFAQGDATLARRHEGAGLGLAIVRKLVEMMGGGVEMDSEPGRGTSVSFHVVLARPRDASGTRPPEKGAHDGAPLTILLVDDNDENIIVGKAFLERLGHDVQAAHDGTRALERLAEQDFDVVLMDIEMPGMDGLEACRRIRDGAAGERVSDIPVVAMTAHAMHGCRERCLEAGMTAYLSKPFRIEQLREVLNAVVEAGREKGGDAGGGQSDDLPNSKSTKPDLDAALSTFDGDAQLLNKLCDIFSRNAPRHLHDLERALEQQDHGSATLAAHSLKGNAATIGARDLSSSAALVHDRVKEGDWVGAARETAELKPLMHAVLAFLEERRIRGE